MHLNPPDQPVLIALAQIANLARHHVSPSDYTIQEDEVVHNALATRGLDEWLDTVRDAGRLPDPEQPQE